MSIFGKILAKLGFGDKPPATKPASTSSVGHKPTPSPATAAAPAKPAVKAITEIDVVAALEKRAKSHPEKLNWKTSIVDLLKLLEIESSLTARKELAKELGCPTEKMGDSAQMNMWLHKTVLRKLAENGGNIPAELLD